MILNSDAFWVSKGLSKIDLILVDSSIKLHLFSLEIFLVSSLLILLFSGILSSFLIFLFLILLLSFEWLSLTWFFELISLYSNFSYLGSFNSFKRNWKPTSFELMPLIRIFLSLNFICLLLIGS